MKTAEEYVKQYKESKWSYGCFADGSLSVSEKQLIEFMESYAKEQAINFARHITSTDFVKNLKEHRHKKDDEIYDNWLNSTHK